MRLPKRLPCSRGLCIAAVVVGVVQIAIVHEMRSTSGAGSQWAVAPAWSAIRDQIGAAVGGGPLAPSDVDPLPGVHMVYLYANGSDPGIALRKPLFGGRAGGK